MNFKTRSANKGSKSRGSFANIYAIYVLVEDYLIHGFHEKGDYSSYEGAVYKNLFKSETANLAALIKEGALVVDVRSKAEFSSGHAKGSINIPLEQITLYLDKFKAQKHVIVC